ncbi:MAG: hypothetical protein NVS3B26_20360 [Mycobacteriales bacterium]
MTAATTSPPLQAATSLADELLRPAAEQVDQTSVPRSHLDALAEAGLLGVTDRLLPGMTSGRVLARVAAPTCAGRDRRR